MLAGTKIIMSGTGLPHLPPPASLEDIASGKGDEVTAPNTPTAAAVRVQALWRRARARGKYAGLLYDALLQKEAHEDHADEEAQEANFRRYVMWCDGAETSCMLPWHLTDSRQLRS